MTFYVGSFESGVKGTICKKSSGDLKITRKVNHFSQLRIGDRVRIKNDWYVVIDKTDAFNEITLFNNNKDFDDLWTISWHEDFDELVEIAFLSNKSTHDLKVGDKVCMSMPRYPENEVVEVIEVFPENNVIDVFSDKLGTVRTIALFCNKIEEQKIDCHISITKMESAEFVVVEFSHNDISCPVSLCLKSKFFQRENCYRNKYVGQELDIIRAWMSNQNVVLSQGNFKDILFKNIQEMLDNKETKRKIKIISDNI